MKILYITYIDFFDEAKSGSSVRPQKIYDAFLCEGHEIVLLQTQQNKRKERKESVKAILNRLKIENIDACYIESPSGPIFNGIDIKLIKKVKEKNIPISFFYRDAHWLFVKSWIKKSKVKKYLIERLQKRDIKVFQKNVDQFYMPSNMACNELIKYYSFHNIKELPPGAEEGRIQTHSIKKTAIYVGGCSHQYGLDSLINVFDKLHKQNYEYKLIIVTRKNEWETMYPNGLEYKWLEVFHISGRELEKVYEKADCAILPLRKNYYFDMAYAIKMFEYLSYGKPVISNNLETMGKFIQKYDCGIIYNETEEEMCKAIIRFYEDKKLSDKLYENTVKACNENTWRKRAQTIIDDFEKLSNEDV